jgi:Tol biopolymer transport system component
VGSRLTAVVASTVVCLTVVVAPARATFPGQNGKIAFACGDGICVINPDGTAKTQITHNPYKFQSCAEEFGCFEVSGADHSPSWSADGRKLLFARARPDGCCEIYTVNADGTGPTDMNAKTFGPHDGPTWSPDGSRFAFVSDSEPGQSQLWVKGVDGTSATAVAQHAKSPNWSPDGRTIVFGVPHPPGALPGTQFYIDLHLVTPDGLGERQITSSPDPECGSSYDNASWSPDGSRLAVAATDACIAYRYLWDIGVMSADGSGLTNLTPNTFDNDDFEPVWSPDGARIAFETDDRIRVMNSDGTGATLITPGHQPDWQPITGPNRSDYKNAAQFCKAEGAFLGDAAFRQKYGGGANAFGKCVSGK